MVCVLDRKDRPLMPCHPARARKLLKKKRARVVRLFPFTIRLADRELEKSAVQEVRLKIDPGSVETGLALARVDGFNIHHALYFLCLRHRGQEIRNALATRRNYRRRRRYANIRHRSPRFNNRRRPAGWLPPSLRHRVDSVVLWTEKLRRFFPISGISMEAVKFDMQKLADPNVSGVMYQQGTLFGYEVREYLLEKFGRKCVYCGKDHRPLNIDHVVPKACGGSDRISNLVLACTVCNQRKADKPLAEFLKTKPDVLKRVKARLQPSYRHAAAVNITRPILLKRLAGIIPAVEAGTGAQTKYNRSCSHIPKEHWLDALCVGQINGAVYSEKMNVLMVKCTGRGLYQRTLTDSSGFPVSYRLRTKRVLGFATGDMVVARVQRGKDKGVHRGRVAVRKSGAFVVQTGKGRRVNANWKCVKLVACGDGYRYTWRSHEN